jgi:hypothetical protein
LKNKVQSLSFINDIANSLGSRPSATHGESTGLPSNPVPKPDKAHNNREGNNSEPDSTLGNKSKGAPTRTEEEERSRNGRGGDHARLKPIRLKEKELTKSSRSLSLWTSSSLATSYLPSQILPHFGFFLYNTEQLQDSLLRYFFRRVD